MKRELRNMKEWNFKKVVEGEWKDCFIGYQYCRANNREIQ
jgi:hypothetical protein